MPTLDEYVESYGDALTRNPPCNSPAYADDPTGVWRYAMRVFGCGLADWPPKEVKKIYGTLYGRWFVRLETFGPNRARVDADEFIGWIRSAEQEERERRRRMNESQAQLAYFIMTHFPDDYENSVDTGDTVCETALKIIMRLSASSCVQPMTYEQAVARLTPSGKRYDELTFDQLNFIISSEKASPESREAARIVLEHDFGAEPPAQTENE